MIAPGTVLGGKYVVERILGEGGMGMVVAATHQSLGHRVAIKTMLPQAAAHPDMLERFEREARAAAGLSSEHAARVTDVGHFDDGMPYMVMEFLEGEDLEHCIARQKPLPIADALRYYIQSCIGLHDAHTAGIVHRDVKPSNIFLAKRQSGRVVVKILDFGIAKGAVSVTDPSLTRTSNTMGSPRYMSPEQLANAKSVDARTDVWSLGATFYEALTGRPAFDAESLALLHVRIMTAEPTPARRLREAIPLELDAVLARCLAKDPSMRYPSMRGLQEDLERIELALAGVHTQPTSYPDLAPPPSSATGQASVFARTVHAGEPADLGDRTAVTPVAPLETFERSQPAIPARTTDVGAGSSAPLNRTDDDAGGEPAPRAPVPAIAAPPPARTAHAPGAPNVDRRGADSTVIGATRPSRTRPAAAVVAAALLGGVGLFAFRALGTAREGASVETKAEGATWYDELVRRVTSLERIVTGRRSDDADRAHLGAAASEGNAADPARASGDPFEEAASIAVRGASDTVCGRPLRLASATLFAPGEAALLTAGTLELQRIVPLLARYADRGFVVSARMPLDDLGASAKLSLARANAVVAWLRLNTSLERTRFVVAGAEAHPRLVDDPSSPGAVTSDDRVEIGMACGLEPSATAPPGPGSGKGPRTAKPPRSPKRAP
jgi:serine/threonine-protein kinase